MLPPIKPQDDESTSVEEVFLPVAIVVEKQEATQPGRKKQDHTYRKIQPVATYREERRYSKFHARGITYHDPFKCYLSALVTVCFLLTLFLSLLIPAHVFMNQNIEIVDIAVLALMVVSGILYFSIALQCRCRTCRTKLFSLGHFLRHKKAHHIPLMGYNIPTGLHILLFFWFRCQACGTAQKLSQK